MEVAMIRLFLSLLIVLSLTLSVGEDGTLIAKPAYCDEALKSCYQECQNLFSSELTRTACYGGCLIGYLTCGS
jgi:hypothetical protein